MHTSIGKIQICFEARNKIAVQVVKKITKSALEWTEMIWRSKYFDTLLINIICGVFQPVTMYLTMSVCTFNMPISEHKPYLNESWILSPIHLKIYV